MTVVRRLRQPAPVVAATKENWWTQGVGFDVLPRPVLADRHLNHAAKLLYALVCGLSKQDGSCRAGSTALARTMGVSRDVVDDALDCLVHGGLLREAKRTGATTLYKPVRITDVYGAAYRDAAALLIKWADSDYAVQMRDIAEESLRQHGAEAALGCPTCTRRRRDANVRRGVDAARSKPKKKNASRVTGKDQP